MHNGQRQYALSSYVATEELSRSVDDDLLGSVRSDGLAVRAFDSSGRGQHLAALVRAVAHHPPPPPLVALLDVLGDLGVHLGSQRLGQHPSGTLAHDLLDQRRRTSGGGNNA